MAKIDVVNLKNEKSGSVDLADSVFGQKVNQPLVLQVIKAQLAGMRQGTAASKTKAEVRGGGKKPFRQKGTGNSRQGSSRSPLMPGGGSAHGPQPRSYHQDTPKKMVKAALRCVLSDKLAANRLVVLDQFNLKSHKTSELNKILKELFKVDKVLLVDKENKNLNLASKNIPRVKFVKTEGINAYDLVNHEWLFVSKDSIDQINKQFA